MTIEDYVRALLALFFVLGLLVGLYLVLKRLQLRGFLGNLGPAGEPGGRLELLSSLGLGGRRQIIVVGRGRVRYVILCSPTRDLLLETYQKTESAAASTASVEGEKKPRPSSEAPSFASFLSSVVRGKAGVGSRKTLLPPGEE